MNYYDISPKITENSAVFPGDESFKRYVSLSFSTGNHLELSSIKTTVHIGSHADAPSHYNPEGQSIDEVNLFPYLGLCQVIRVKVNPGERILPMHLRGEEIRAPRVLFHTGSFPNTDEWRSDFNSLSPELITFLAEKEVILVGIDTPSIDPHDSKALESHQTIFDTKIAVLEGLDLNETPSGVYQLVALPLKIGKAEASPVRAILLPLKWDISRH